MRLLAQLFAALKLLFELRGGQPDEVLVIFAVRALERGVLGDLVLDFRLVPGSALVVRLAVTALFDAAQLVLVHDAFFHAHSFAPRPCARAPR